MFPLAPERFSTMTCCPSLADRSAARRRAGISIEPPAAKGTTMVIGREGQFWAAAVRDDMLSSAAANAQRLGFLTVVSPTLFSRTAAAQGYHACQTDQPRHSASPGPMIHFLSSAERNVSASVKCVTH